MKRLPTIPDIGCDLGEGEPPEHTRALMRWIDAAHIACGGHAGDDASIEFCLRTALAEGVRAGAHPGIPTRDNLGRIAPASLSVTDFLALLNEQVERLLSIAHRLGVPVHHVKLHGALYHLVDHDPALGRAYLDQVVRRWPHLAVIARAGGGLAALATTATRHKEAFLDRGYRSDGTLIPRGEPGALLDDAEQVLGRLRDLRDRGGWRSNDGDWVSLDPDTLCVHGDSPNALTLLQRLRNRHPRRSRSSADTIGGSAAGRD